MAEATLTPQDFRLALAGLADPEADEQHKASTFRTQSISLAITMAELFSDSFDRKTLWERIGTGLASAATKRPEGGESFVAACLEHVKADPGKAAANANLYSTLIDLVGTQSAEWHRGWAAYVARQAVIVVVHARAQWQERKEAKNA